MNPEAKTMLLVGLYALSKIQRGAPDLNEADADGTSLLGNIWARVLDEALPTLSAAEVEAALRALPAAGPWFPAPAELIAEVRQNRRQRALRAQEEASEARAKALLPAPASAEDAEARQEALGRIQAILSDLTAKLGPPPPPVPRRSLAEMEAEVARLRVMEGKLLFGDMLG